MDRGDIGVRLICSSDLKRQEEQCCLFNTGLKGTRALPLEPQQSCDQYDTTFSDLGWKNYKYVYETEKPCREHPRYCTPSHPEDKDKSSSETLSKSE